MRSILVAFVAIVVLAGSSLASSQGFGGTSTKGAWWKAGHSPYFAASVRLIVAEVRPTAKMPSTEEFMADTEIQESEIDRASFYNDLLLIDIVDLPEDVYDVRVSAVYTMICNRTTDGRIGNADGDDPWSITARILPQRDGVFMAQWDFNLPERLTGVEGGAAVGHGEITPGTPRFLLGVNDSKTRAVWAVGLIEPELPLPLQGPGSQH